MRAAAYCRVSTGRQADGDLSLPDQQRQIEAYCRRKGWQLVKVFIEPGASARDDERPVFRSMIAEAVSAGHPFDHVVVHSLSRFFRDEALGELYVRRLRKHQVSLQSVTQEIGSDPISDLARRVVGLLDEHTSKETAKHTLRSMEENARQGYWNGSRPPFGYRVVTAGTKGIRTKKKLAIDAAEADIVRRVFALYLTGENGSGPRGLKAIATHLNAEGVSVRGRRLSLRLVHLILSRETYAGRHFFNVTDSRTRQTKRCSDWVEVRVPAIVDEKTFAAAEKRLKNRDPRKARPRVSGSPHLLTGLARCARCGGAMTMASGKSGRYRYYKCSTFIRVGPTGCAGMVVPMHKLDELVIDTLRERVLSQEFLKATITEHRQRALAVGTKDRELVDAEAAASRAEAAVDRLFQLVAGGVLGAEDPDLRRHLSEAQALREAASQRLLEARAAAEPAIPDPTNAQIRALANLISGKLKEPGIEARKAGIQLIVDKILVDRDTVKLIGNARKLATLAANLDETGVIGFMAVWRPQRESNPCLHRERVVS